MGSLKIILFFRGKWGKLQGHLIKSPPIIKLFVAALGLV
jgi:hypothetical protein